MTSIKTFLKESAERCFNKISRQLICRCAYVVLLFVCTSCQTGFYSQLKKNHAFSKKIYEKYQKDYGNASMLLPMGNYSVIWYYNNDKIFITDIIKNKISSQREYECSSILNIKTYNPGCYPESLDADIFESSFHDPQTDSLYHVNICLDVHRLVIEGSECPFMKKLREHILTYNLGSSKLE